MLADHKPYSSFGNGDLFLWCRPLMGVVFLLVVLVVAGFVGYHVGAIDAHKATGSLWVSGMTRPMPPGMARLRAPLRSHAVTASPAGAVSVSRRTAAWMPVAVAGALSLPKPAKADGATGELLHYEDRDCALDYPASWKPAVTEIAGRRKLLSFAGEGNPNENINIVFSPVSADFTQIGAFGTLEGAGAFFVPSGPGLTSNLLDSKLWNSGEGYLYEYTLKDRTRFVHFRTGLALIPGRTLVTITTQCNEEDWARLESVYAAVLKSFQLTGGYGYGV